MKTSYQIYCDYSKAISKARTLESMAEKINSVAMSEIVEETANLNASWQATSMTIVSGKSIEIADDLKNQSKNLLNIATAIRRIARRNFDAEMRSLELAKKREYGN